MESDQSESSKPLTKAPIATIGGRKKSVLKVRQLTLDNEDTNNNTNENNDLSLEISSAPIQNAQTFPIVETLPKRNVTFRDGIRPGGDEAQDFERVEGKVSEGTGQNSEELFCIKKVSFNKKFIFEKLNIKNFYRSPKSCLVEL